MRKLILIGSLLFTSTIALADVSLTVPAVKFEVVDENNQPISQGAVSLTVRLSKTLRYSLASVYTRSILDNVKIESYRPQVDGQIAIPLFNFDKVNRVTETYKNLKYSAHVTKLYLPDYSHAGDACSQSYGSYFQESGDCAIEATKEKVLPKSKFTCEITGIGQSLENAIVEYKAYCDSIR
jgi:hypothetical protein